MKGKIIKGIAGFYYVHTPEENRVFECKAKGIFRNQNKKPLVGDDVEIKIEDQRTCSGTIIDILPRKNEIIRPAVANIDQAMVIFAAAEPKPNLNLLDRFLIMMQKQNINTIVCFNKKDIVSNEELFELGNVYKLCGCELIFTSMLHRDGLTGVTDLMKGKTTVLAGPSGVGKSTLVNAVAPKANMETGSVSEKIKRGKHTTRHSELIYIDEDTYLMDTPGFSSLYINEVEKEELKDYFAEFHEYEEFCRFIGCSHRNEPACAVKGALKDNKISKIRYESYLTLYQELQDKRRY